MKRTVLVFGLIAGGIMTAMMMALVPFADRIGFDRSVIIGYTTIVIGFLMIFFGIRSYRENVGAGKISFGRGLAIGLLITLIASLIYAVVWQFVYFNFMPDFLDKYAQHVADKARAAGASAEAIQAQMKEMQDFKTWYSNPLFNLAVTIWEPLPVGLIISFVSALVLRKR